MKFFIMAFVGLLTAQSVFAHVCKEQTTLITVIPDESLESYKQRIDAVLNTCLKAAAKTKANSDVESLISDSSRRGEYLGNGEYAPIVGMVKYRMKNGIDCLVEYDASKTNSAVLENQPIKQFIQVTCE
ncbi:MAG: hypothetical protein ACXVCY_03565 [Pseudobdellovibrionaceae bacterium]